MENIDKEVEKTLQTLEQLKRIKPSQTLTEKLLSIPEKVEPKKQNKKFVWLRYAAAAALFFCNGLFLFQNLQPIKPTNLVEVISKDLISTNSY